MKGLNLSKFKKISSDDKITTLRHPDGHEFRVAHKALTPRLKKDLEALPMAGPVKMADGGESPKKNSTESDPSLQSTTPDIEYSNGVPQYKGRVLTHPLSYGNAKANEANEAEGYKAAGGDVKRMKDGGDTAETASEEPTATSDQSAAPVVINVNPAPTAQQPAPTVMQRLGAAATRIPGGPGDIIRGAQAAGQLAEAAVPYAGEAVQGFQNAVAGQPANAPVAPIGTPAPAESAAPAATPVAAPASPLAGLPAAGQGLPAFNPADIYKQGQQAIGLQQQSEQIGAKERLRADEQHTRELAERQFNFNQGLQEKQQEIDSATEDYKKGHINPNHFLESKSVIGKLSTAVGLILGGAGAGIVHGENQALKFLNAQIDRDIGAQQAEMGKRQTLIGAYQKQYDNMQVAEHMARATELGIYSAHLDEAAAKAADPAAAARAAQASTALKLQIPALLQQAQTLQMMQNIGKPGVKYDLMDLARTGILPKEFHEQAQKETKSIDMQKSAVDGVKDIYNQYRQEQTTGQLTNPQSYKRVSALNGRLVNLIMEASPSKRLTKESVSEEIKPFQVKTTDTDETVNKKMSGVLDMVKRNSEPTPLAEKYGVFRPDELYGSKQQQARQIPEGATGTYQGKPVIFRGGKWQAK